MQNIGKLLIARHHESEWNKKGQWTGSRDIHLTPYGFKKSEEMGLLIKGIQIDRAFASMQVRSIETLSCMLNALGFFHVQTQHLSALNERDYGDYTGKNKWEMHDLVGEEMWNKIRREWDFPIPNGESLRMVYDRAVPFYLESILPLLKAGNNVLVVSHGNAIRAIMKYIEKIPEKDMAHLEMLFGAVLIYDVDEAGYMIHKEVRHVESEVHA